MCFGIQATIKPQTRDRYGRTVARVQCRGEDASAAQLRAGMAWFFVRYGRDATLPPIEAQARIEQIGLWKDAEAAPPWEWRRGKGREVGRTD